MSDNSAGAVSRPTKSEYELKGRVVDDSGAPIDSFTIVVYLPNDTSLGDATAVESFSAAGGAFSVPIDAGQWILSARTELGHSVPTSITIPSGEEAVLVVPRLAALLGFVRAVDEIPIAGAQIFVLIPDEFDESLSGDFSKLTETAKSDPAGAFYVDNLPSGTVYVAAWHESFCESERIEVALSPGGTSAVDLYLPIGGTVSGSLHPSLAPVAGRQVALFSMRGKIGWRLAKTSSTGQFLFEHVVPQDYIIELRPPENENGEHSASRTRKVISVRDGETTRVEFGNIGTVIQVTGRIAAASVPLQGASIMARPRGALEDRGCRGQADVGGSYALELLEPGTYLFTISVGQGSFVNFERAVPNSPTVSMDFEVPTGSISGVVTLPDGNPAVGVPMTITRAPTVEESPETFVQRIRETHTDADGHFAFLLLEVGLYTIRTIDGAQFDSPSRQIHCGRVMLRDVSVGHDPIAQIAIQLQSEGTVRGRVLDSLGNPLGNVWVRVELLDGVALTATWDSRTGANGEFVIGSVAPGSYVVHAHTGTLEGVSQPVHIVEGRVTEVTLSLP